MARAADKGVRVTVARPFRYPVRSQRRLAAGTELHVTAEQAAAWERQGMVHISQPPNAELADLAEALAAPADAPAPEPAAAKPKAKKKGATRAPTGDKPPKG